MNLFNAINNMSSNIESMGALFGRGSAGLSGLGEQLTGSGEEFEGFLRQFMGAEPQGFMSAEPQGFMGGKVEKLMSNMDQFMGGNQNQAAAADKFLASLAQQGIDPQRFLADLEAEGIDPESFLADLNREGVTSEEFLSAFMKQSTSDKQNGFGRQGKALLSPKNQGNLSLSEVAEKAAALGGLNLKKFIEGNDSVVESILSKNGLDRQDTDIKASPFSFMKGGNEDVQKLAAILDNAKAALPDTFKKQLGQSLLARGQEGLSANSMKMGVDLMGAKNGVKALKDMLETLDGELPVLNMDKEALPLLGELMAESGMDDATINQMLGDLAKGDMDMDQVFFMLSKATNDLEQQGSLVATREGLSGLGQLFSSLGVSPEVVESIVGGIEEGSVLTGGALKDAIAAADADVLKQPISAADAENLSNALKAMGASPRQMNSLANLLQQTNGKMSVNDFASFFDEMGPGQDVSVGGKELDLIKNIMANITRDQEIAKTPVFNEILTKLQAMGDEEIDEDFGKMSPGLQALRGGISGQNADAALGGQMGQNGQGGQQQEREAQQQYRQAMQAVHTGADTVASGTQTTETMQNYGYGSQDSLSRQISQKILYSHNKGIHRLRMKLNPESMGGLDIELKVKNGELNAHIKAESREAYEALADEIDSLKAALEEGGVKLGNMTLAFDNTESGTREFADLGMRGQRANTKHEEESENIIDPAIISQMAQNAAHDGLLSRFV